MAGDKVHIRAKDKNTGRVQRSSPVVIKDVIRDAIGIDKYRIRMHSGELKTVPGAALVPWRHPQNASDITGIIDIPNNATLGEGSYGSVRRGFFRKRVPNRVYYAGRNLKENKEYAVKVQQDEEARREIRIFRRLGNDLYIGKYYGFGYVLFENQKRIAMVMEMYDKDLDKLREQTSPADVPKTFLRVATQLFNALGFLEEKKVIHLDIKPENIMFDNRNILKLIDFGMAKTHSVKLESMKDYGLPFQFPHQMYFAWPPEQLLDTGTCSYKWDVYSAAVALLLFLENPKNGLDQKLPSIYIDYWKGIDLPEFERELEFTNRTQFIERAEMQSVFVCNALSDSTGPFAIHRLQSDSEQQEEALCLRGPFAITRMLANCLREEARRPSWQQCLFAVSEATRKKRQSSDDESGAAAKRARVGSVDERLKNLRF